MPPARRIRPRGQVIVRCTCGARYHFAVQPWTLRRWVGAEPHLEVWSLRCTVRHCGRDVPVTVRDLTRAAPAAVA